MENRVAPKTAIFFIITIFLISSCSKEEVKEKNNKDVLKEFKNEIISFGTKMNFHTTKNAKLLTYSKNDYEQSFQSSLSKSVDVIKSYGITESDIIADFGSLNNPGIIEVALAICKVEFSANNGIELIDTGDYTSLLTGEPKTMIQCSKSELYDCALQAIGITAICELIDNGISNMSKSAARKILKKVASKYLGWVGAGIAVYEFGDCMDWW